MKNSSLIHTDLVFEYVSNMDVELNTKIDPEKTTIDCPKIGERVDQSDMNQEPKD